MKSTPFLIKADKTGQALTRIDPQKKQYTENWLQELLQRHPKLLPVEEFESMFSPVTPIGREIPTNAGPIDNLFISEQGCLVIVETKLWRNAEAKREVLAQVIDYAAEVSKWSFMELDEKARKYCHKGLIEIIQSSFDPDSEEVPTENMIAKNLRLGRFLILIVSDHIRSSLVDMLTYVNRYPHLATNVGLVELQCYQMPGDQSEIMVVPSIVAKTEIVERSIVQVNIVPEVEHTLSVEQIKNEPGSESRRAISEDVFWETLKQKSPASVGPARKILEHFHSHSEIILKMRRTAIVARMTMPDTDQKLSLFYISTDGSLNCWVSTLIGQLENAGLDREMGVEYEKKLSQFLTRRTSSLSIYSPVDKVNIQAFVAVVDDFIGKILKTQMQPEA
jgi:hypothetical protein